MNDMLLWRNSPTLVLRHLALIAVRVLLGLLIAAALPLSHLWLSYYSRMADFDEPEALMPFFGLAVMGVVIAGIFVALGSIFHYVVRRKAGLVLWVDVSVGIIAFLCTFCAGIIAAKFNVP